MSVKVQALIWEHYPSGGSELVLALALADWANHDGTGIWASVPLMASKTRQSDRNVQYQLAKMKKNGWLVMVDPPGGQHRSTTYRIPIDRLPLGVEGWVKTLHPRADEAPVDNLPTSKLRGERDGKNGCNPRSKGVKAVSPDLSVYVINRQNQQHGAGAALHWPPKIPTAQRSAIEAYMRKHPNCHAQQLLDELQGIMASKRVGDPMALFLHLAKAQTEDRWIPSHAHRVQLEREGEQARRQLQEEDHAQR